METNRQDHANRSDLLSSMRFSARSEGRKEEYLPLAAQGLNQAVAVESGTGRPDDPWLCRVVVRNDSRRTWRGVVRLDVEIEAAAPHFFLPGFMYGTNRGDMPLVTDRKTPRLRPEPTAFPASSWWLTRSDRLSHPVAMAFAGHRVVGLSAALYYLRSQSGQVPWNYPSDAYITWLNLMPEVEHIDTIDCRDLFNGKDERERIEIYRLRNIESIGR